MKPRYYIGLSIAAVFIVIAILSFDKSTIEYANFPDAKLSGKQVQVIGSLVKDKEAVYDSKKNLLTFYVIDKQDNESMVLYEGPPPPNFEIAEFYVIKGSYIDDHFSAVEIYTKCPSKYEGTIEDLKKNTKTEVKKL